MISKVVMPDLGATGGPVTLIEWLVATGEQVRAGQPLFLVETDKAAVEVEAFRDGLVRQLLVETGDSVPLGGVVALLADSLEEPLPDILTAKDHLEAVPLPGPIQYSFTTERDGRLLVSPVARRLAKTEGIDLLHVEGTGRQGQILKRDVVEALYATGIDLAEDRRIRREPVSGMRKAIARLTSKSKNEIPHFYADITVDMTQALAMLQEAREYAKESDRYSPTITDVCLRAAGLTLIDFPQLNASLLENEILYYLDINIGLVVGLEEGGLLVPVIHNADRFDLYTLAAVSSRLKERAESGILRESELSSGTFTLSNLGMFGIDSFTAVINPPQAGMLALGAVQEAPAVHNGAIVARPLMKATLSVDHRLVDGVAAARFLTSWKELLENPANMMVENTEETGR